MNNSKTLSEFKQPRQIPGEPARRCFISETMDLIIWLDAKNEPQGFQLCYGKPLQERALTWNADRGFSHLGVDDGSVSGLGHKSTPVLIADGNVDPRKLLVMFEAVSDDLPEAIVRLVQEALRRHPDFSHEQ